MSVPAGWMVLVVVDEVTQPTAVSRTITAKGLCMNAGSSGSSARARKENVFFGVASRIHLVRHGVSAHTHDGSWVDAARARRFIELYDAAGIREEAPPADVIEMASRADVLAASSLPRAIESVGRLAPGRDMHTTPLLREIDLQTPGLLPVRLPITTWDVIDYFVNGYRIRLRRPTP